VDPWVVGQEAVSSVNSAKDKWINGKRGKGKKGSEGFLSF